MKVGDLVAYSSPGITRDYVGLIVGVGKWAGNCDIKVLWAHEKAPLTQKSFHVKVISASR
jgi:hypothetical protein